MTRTEEHITCVACDTALTETIEMTRTEEHLMSRLIITCVACDTALTETIERIARECADEALRQGALARELAADEDAFAGDYEAAEQGIGRPLGRADVAIFRAAYSARLARTAPRLRFRLACNEWFLSPDLLVELAELAPGLPVLVRGHGWRHVTYAGEAAEVVRCAKRSGDYVRDLSTWAADFDDYDAGARGAELPHWQYLGRTA